MKVSRSHFLELWKLAVPADADVCDGGPNATMNGDEYEYKEFSQSITYK